MAANPLTAGRSVVGRAGVAGAVIVGLLVAWAAWAADSGAAAAAEKKSQAPASKSTASPNKADGGKQPAPAPKQPALAPKPPAGAALADGDRPPTAAELEFFEKRIRPVLVAQCYKCHSAASGEAKGGLVLDTREGIRRGGTSGHAVVPGSLRDSLLIEAIRYESFEMPPEAKLPDEVIADFERWVRGGAADPREPPAASGVAAAAGWEAKRDLWSIQPLAKVEPPAVENGAWPRTAVDRFLLARLEAEGLAPVADAEPATLLRRLYFALVGLPPAPEDVAAFVADPSPQAVERVVDRLLASPQFGERWGRYWLDVARFAESNGRERDVLFPHAWRYRDYVFDAFHADKPFDRFIVEQLAGDLLPVDAATAPDGQDPRDELIVATGFLAIGPKSLQQRGEELLVDMVDEQLDTTTRAFLGLTVSCARCHDHKFDPIPQTDYYAISGFFRSTQTLYGEGIDRANGRGKDVSGLLARLSDETLGPEPAERQKFERRRDQVETALRVERKRLADRAEDLEDARRKKDARQQQIAKTLYDRSQARLQELEQELAALEKSAPPAVEYAMAVRDFEKPEDSPFYTRGDIKQRGDRVPRAFLSAFTVPGAPEVDRSQSGRLQLARWIASPHNPLTPRVAVNRVWQQLFGTGLVASVDNLGHNGDKPSHPELLDYLAREFVADGWSTKRLIRRLVLSRAFQLSSDDSPAGREQDPDNRLVWRYTPRRLDAEAFRDAILSVSGSLNLARPEASVVARLGDGEMGRGKINTTLLREESPHRSCYLPIVRSEVPEALKVFDFAEPSIVVGRRNVTTVPSQALFLMNGPFVLRESQRFAERLAGAAPDDRARIVLAHRLCFARDPSAAEIERAEAFLASAAESLAAQESESGARRRAAWALYCQALLGTAEFRFVN